MIKNRNLVILAIVLVALAGVSLLQRFVHRRAVTRPAQARLLQTELKADELTRIVLGQGADSTAVVLERLPDKWVVRTAFGHPANPGRMDDLIRNLVGLRGEFRSDAADVLADYGLDRENAVRADVFGKDFQPVLSVLVGKKPQGAVGDFVRQPGSNAVYLTDASILGPMGLWSGPARPQSRHFLELQAYKAERNDVEALVLTSEGKSIELVKEFPPAAPAATPAPGDTARAAAPPESDRSVYEWRMIKPRAAAALKTKADAVLNGVAQVRAVDVADPAGGDLMSYDLWQPKHTAQLRFKGGQTFNLYFGDTRPEEGDTPGGVYMRTESDNTIWVVRETLVTLLFPKADELLATK